MSERYEVRVSEYQANSGWREDLVGTVRSYFVYDMNTQTVVAKLPCYDVVENQRNAPMHTNDPVHQRIRAHKLCVYMNAIETNLVNAMVETEL